MGNQILSNPKSKRYKLSVFLMGLLGYTYIFLILVIVFLLISGIIFLIATNRRIDAALVKILIFTVCLAWFILRAIWVKMPPPEGIEITSQEAPELFQLLAEIKGLLNVSAKKVLINSDFNASVIQHPSLGIFGWYKNYLNLGLPLLEAVSPDQLKAVLVHEFGHLSSEHGQLGCWIYRLEASWYRIIEQTREKGSRNFLFYPFFKWYFPRFQKLSFALRRANEYEADRTCAELAGLNSFAQALVIIELKEKSLNALFWPDFWAKTKTQENLPSRVFSQMVEHLHGEFPQDKKDLWLKQVILPRSFSYDSHPSLNERLQVFKFSFKNNKIIDQNSNILEYDTKVEHSAAEKYLGVNLLADLRKNFDGQWEKDMSPRWESQYKAMQEYIKQLNALFEKEVGQKLNARELWHKAYLLHDTYALDDKVMNALRQVLEIEPGHASANYRLGEYLLKNNDENGVGFLEKAVVRDPRVGYEAHQYLSCFYDCRGDYEKSEYHYKKVEEYDRFFSLANEERAAFLSLKDKFIEHGLSEERINQVVAQLLAFEKQIEEVYFVQKEMKFFPELPMYVLFVKNYLPWNRYQDAQAENKKLLDALCQDISIDVEPGSWIISVGATALIKKVRKINKGLIYKRNKVVGLTPEHI